jgi:hypothetical protein
MKHPKNVFRFSLLIFLIIGFSFLSCMEYYMPKSEWEMQEYSQTDFQVYPNQVRRDLANYKSTRIAWVGIIQESEFYENPDNYEVILLLEHRYFDWAADYSMTKSKYVVSTQGDGLFQTSWRLKKDADLDYFMDRFGKGNLAIVYATPDTVINDIVLVKSRYIRILDKSEFNATESNYIPEKLIKPPYKTLDN